MLSSFPVLHFSLLLAASDKIHDPIQLFENNFTHGPAFQGNIPFELPDEFHDLLACFIKEPFLNPSLDFFRGDSHSPRGSHISNNGDSKRDFPDYSLVTIDIAGGCANPNCIPDFFSFHSSISWFFRSLRSLRTTRPSLPRLGFPLALSSFQKASRQPIVEPTHTDYTNANGSQGA